jgi:16S rRNA G1207 methylase RsmC
MPDLANLKQDIVFAENVRGHRLVFHSTWGLFSPRGIDDGTRALLDRMEVNEGDDCLDLGCGYGPIGLTMARLSKTGTVYMADKDFVAVEYAQRNAKLNRVDRCECVLSNGCAQLPDVRFEVIAANLPSNTGKELLQILLLEARERLKPRGRLYLVTVNGLRDVIKRYLRDYYSNYEKVKQSKAHAVAMATRL